MKVSDIQLSDLLYALRHLCPNATVGQDLDGQIVIYTNKKLSGYELEEMEEAS